MSDHELNLLGIVLLETFAAPTDLILGAFEELQRGADAQSVPQSLR